MPRRVDHFGRGKFNAVIRRLFRVSSRCFMALWLLSACAAVATGSPVELWPSSRPTPVFVPPHAVRPALLVARQTSSNASVFTPQGCLVSSTPVATINALISASGSGFTLPLCPSTTYAINDTIALSAANQTITTLGNRARACVRWR